MLSGFMITTGSLKSNTTTVDNAIIFEPVLGKTLVRVGAVVLSLGGGGGGGGGGVPVEGHDQLVRPVFRTFK